MWIDDPLDCREFESPFASIDLPLFRGQLLKISDNSLNEIAAYQLAKRLSLPSPAAKFFVLRQSTVFNGEEYESGAVALLLENLNIAFKATSIHVPFCTKEQVGDYLSFSIFDRGHEWPEICKCEDGAISFFDFESMFPFVGNPSSIQNCLVNDYAKASKNMIEECYFVAAKEGARIQFMARVRTLDQQLRYWKPDLQPFKRGDVMESVFRSAIQARLDYLAVFLTEKLD